MGNVFFYDHLIFPLSIVEIFVGFRYESRVVFGLQKSPRPLRVRGDFSLDIFVGGFGFIIYPCRDRRPRRSEAVRLK